MKTRAQVYWEALGVLTVRPDLPGLKVPAAAVPADKERVDKRAIPWRKLNALRKAVKEEAASLRHYGTYCGNEKVRRVTIATADRLDKMAASDDE